MINKTIDFKYRPDIDGLRAIAVLSVVFFHAIPDYWTGGFAGVDVFFVISGFLISNIIIQNIDNNTFRISDFYQRRVRRIFPALIFILLVVLIIGWICLLPEELKQLGKHIAASVGFSQNLILWKEAGYFDIASEFKPLLHVWSLGVEEQFYLVWPIFLVLIGKVFRKKRWIYLSATILVFIISFYFFLNMVREDFTKAFYLPQYRFWEMASGGILALVVLYKPKRYFENKFNK